MAARDDAVHPWHPWGLGAFLLIVAAQLVTITAVSEFVQESPSGWYGLIALAAPSAIGALAAVVITRVRGNGPLLDLRLIWRLADLKIGLRIGLLGLILTTVTAAAWSSIVGESGASTLSELVQGRQVTVPAAIALCGYFVVLGPVLDEIVYRGVLWGAIERMDLGTARRRRIAAFVITSLVFAASSGDPQRFVLLLVIALPIATARLVTGRLPAAIVAHQVNNFLPALAVLLGAFGYYPPR